MNISEDQKRWLVVGIAFNKLVSQIRPFVEQSLQAQYRSLQFSHNIHAQSPPGPILKNHPKHLKYENINSNINHKLSSGKFDFFNFDYKVTSHVDFAKLYVQPFMAKFSAFDGKCDGSAILLLLGEVPVFSLAVQSSAKTVREHVRNEWAHCNFTDWDARKFQSCFQEMQQLVQSISLPTADETKLLSELNDWETKGTTFCGNSPVDPSLLNLVHNEVLELSTNLDEFLCQYKEHKDLLESQFLEVKQSLEQLLELPQKVEQIEHEVETLKQQVADLSCNSVKRQESAKPPTFFGALDRNEYFTGRKKELENLEKAFGDNDTEPDVRGVAGRKANVHGICGLGGCGKSSLAFEYAWRNIKRYPGGVFVVNGESDDLMRASIQRIYEEFLLNTLSNQREEVKQFDQLLTQTLSWLGHRKDKWLLLVDNMDQRKLSPCTRTVFLGQWKSNSSGDILVTSRKNSQALCEDLALPSKNCFDLDLLSVNESVEFLRKRTGLSSSCEDQDQEERELAQELGGLPLALEQAAAYIKALKCPIQLYLKQYRSQKLTLLNTKSAQPRTEIYNEARLAVQTTWILNFNYVENGEKDQALGKAAAFVMKIAAYLSPDEIPIDVLNVGAPEIEHGDLKKRLERHLGTDQIVEMLVRFSLFKQKSVGILSVHRLVQETLRDRCDSEGETEKVLSSAIRMMHHAFLKCKGGKDFLSDLYEKLTSEKREGQSHREQFNQVVFFSLVSVPLEIKPWKKLLANAFHLVCNVLKDSSLKPHFRCEESSRLFCEAAYFCYSLGMESQGYRLQQLVFEVLCAIKEPIRYYRDDELLKVTRILRPFTDAALLRQSISLSDSNDPNEKNSVCADSSVISNQMYELLETIKLMEPKAREAFSVGDFQKCADLCTEIVKISNFNASRRGTLKCKQPHLVPLGEILCHRGIAHLKMGNFETAVDDCNASICVDIQCYRGYYWKAYALCKLVESGRTEFTSRAQAAAAVLHFKFADSKRDDIEKLQRRFQKVRGLLHRIEYKFVSRVSELKELESRLSESSNEFSNDSLTIILADGHYRLKAMTILRGRYYFVCPPGCSAILWCTKGLLLSQGTFLFENVDFFDPDPIISVLASSTAPEIIFPGVKLDKGLEECFASVHFDTVTFGKRNPAETDLTARTERDVVALIEAYDVHSLVIDHCQIVGPPCTGIAIVFTECSDEQNEQYITVSSSKITNCGKTGIQIHGNAPFCRISIHNNNVVHNLYGIVIDCPSRFYVENNHIFSNTLSGVVAIRASDGRLRKNSFTHNGKHGILVYNSTAKVEDNVIANNRGWGIVCSGESNLRCKENVLENNLCGGCRLMFNGKGDVLVQGCEFRENCGPAIFPKAANELCRMELELKQLSSASRAVPVPSYIRLFLEGIDPIYDSFMKFTSPVVRDNRESEFSAVLFPDIQLTFCSACWKDLRQMDSDVIKCPSCQVAQYCSQQCSDTAKAVHNPVCKSILESNKVCDDYDVFMLSKSPPQAQEDDGNKADNSLCVIASVTSTDIGGPLSDIAGMNTTFPFHGCLLTYPEKNLSTLVMSSVIHHFISMYGIHLPDSMTDIKAACILANFDSESRKITVYMHRIFPLEKVPDALNWVDRALKMLEK